MPPGPPARLPCWRWACQAASSPAWTAAFARDHGRHCCIWAKGMADEPPSGASVQVEARENFSKRSIARAIRGVQGSQWRT